MPRTSPAAQEAARSMSARVGAAIKRELKERGLHQTELARRTGIDRSTVNKMLTGKLPISMANTQLFAEALQLTVSVLTEGAEPENLRPSVPMRDSPSQSSDRGGLDEVRKAFVARRQRDLSPTEVDFILGTEFPAACDVPESDDFWEAVLLAFRTGRLQRLR